jgi:hypothetical protein
MTTKPTPKRQSIELQHAWARSIELRTKLTNIEADVRAGNLLHIDEVERLFFTGFRAVRDQVLAVPAHAAPRLASKFKLDATTTFNALDDLVRGAIEEAHSRVV